MTFNYNHILKTFYVLSKTFFYLFYAIEQNLKISTGILEPIKKKPIDLKNIPVALSMGCNKLFSQWAYQVNFLW